MPKKAQKCKANKNPRVYLSPLNSIKIKPMNTKKSSNDR